MRFLYGQNSPSSPHSLHIHTLSNIDDKFHVGVVVVVGAARYLCIVRQYNSIPPHCMPRSSLPTNLNILVRHTDVISICLQIFRCGHDGELNRPFIAKSLVCPFPDRADLLDRCDTIVGDEDLYTQEHQTLAYPSSDFKIQPKVAAERARTFVMTVWPPCACTKSLTLLCGATPKWFPPMKCEGRLYFAALLLGPPLALATPLVAISRERKRPKI